MCKIAVISNITDDTSENAMKFIKQMAKDMTWQDDDGFGYAIVDSKGQLYGERWKNPKEAFISYKAVNEISQNVVSKFKGMLKAKSSLVTYNNFGVKTTEPIRSAILHARKATTPNIMENTHPFVNSNVCLIHNGIIRNTDELQMKISSCDSETILNEYIKHGVADDIKKIQTVAHNLQGYYACAVFAKQSNGRLILDVFKDKGARLAAYYVDELKSVVIATPSSTVTSTNGDAPYGPVPSTCRDLKFTILDHYEVEDSSIVRLDAITGEVIDQLKFDSVYKEKKKNKKNKHGGNSGNTQGEGYCEYGDTAERWENMYGSHSHHRKTWTDSQKDGELERMLTDITNSSYRDLNDDTPPLLLENRVKTAQEVADELTQDFVQDETGVWHRKGTGTDREK